jgi:hypothetical protein
MPHLPQSIATFGLSALELKAAGATFPKYNTSELPTHSLSIGLSRK